MSSGNTFGGGATDGHPRKPWRRRGTLAVVPPTRHRRAAAPHAHPAARGGQGAHADRPGRRRSADHAHPGRASPSTNNGSATRRPENGSMSSSGRCPLTASPPSPPPASTSGSTTATNDSPPASTHSSTDWRGRRTHHPPADRHRSHTLRPA